MWFILYLCYFTHIIYLANKTFSSGKDNIILHASKWVSKWVAQLLHGRLFRLEELLQKRKILILTIVTLVIMMTDKDALSEAAEVLGELTSQQVCCLQMSRGNPTC